MNKGNRTKIIANYLPQYHEIPENNEFWGKGFTDWVTVKNAKSLFEGHLQPKVPYNEHYYDLSKQDEIYWQIELANKYGIYGFGIYHYWFGEGHQVLEKPAEIILKNPDMNIHIMFIWDNVSWRRTWSSNRFSNVWAPLIDSQLNDSGNGYLIELKYGEKEEWERHFNYLLPFFKDERYIRMNNKPVFGIFNQDNDSNTLKKMFSYWNQLAKKEGLNGIEIIGKKNNQNIKICETEFLYQPIWFGWTRRNIFTRALGKIKRSINHRESTKPLCYSYDSIWKKTIQHARRSKASNELYSGFVSYDDTPRRGIKGKVTVGSNPKKFEKYLKELLSISDEQGKEFVFLTAWNEWGEGAYLEPDVCNQYKYLEAVKRCTDY